MKLLILVLRARKRQIVSNKDNYFIKTWHWLLKKERMPNIMSVFIIYGKLDYLKPKGEKNRLNSVSNYT